MDSSPWLGLPKKWMVWRKNGGCVTWASPEPRTNCISPGHGRGGGAGSFGQEWHYPSSVLSLQGSLRSGGLRRCGHRTGARAVGRTGGEGLIGGPGGGSTLGEQKKTPPRRPPASPPNRPP